MLRNFSKAVRCVVATAFVGATAALPQSASAAGNVQIQQQVEYRYAQSFTFKMEATADFQILTARIMVRSGGGAELFEKVIELAPQTSARVETSVDVSELGIGAYAQLSSQWEVADVSGTTYLSDPAQILYEDQNVAWEWQTVEDPTFVVHWDGKDEILAATIIDVAHQSLDRASLVTGTESALPMIHIYVYRDLTSMASALRLHKQRVSDWVAAYSYPKDHIILIASEGGPEGHLALERDVAHELAHILIHAGEGQAQVPGWFDEGTAIVLSTENDSPSNMLREEVNNGVLLSLESLCASGFAGMPIQDAGLAYAESANLMKYVMERYGASQVSALADAYKGGASCDAGVRQALGISLVQLENQWHAELEAETLHPPSAGSAIPWAVIWLASIVLALCLVMPSSTKQGFVDASETRASLESVNNSPLIS